MLSNNFIDLYSNISFYIGEQFMTRGILLSFVLFEACRQCLPHRHGRMFCGSAGLTLFVACQLIVFSLSYDRVPPRLA